MFQDVFIPLWSSLSHERLVPLLADHTDNNLRPKIEVPFYNEGNILQYNRQHLNANKWQQIVQIAEGLEYLHEKLVVHGNVCPVRSFI